MDTRLVALATAILLAALRPAPGAEYYVSPLGNDAHVGRIDRPWKTPAHAIGRAAPGDVVFFRQGTYDGPLRFTRSGTADAPIMFRAYPGETVVIQSGDVNLNLTGVDHLCIDGFTLRDPVNHWAVLIDADHNVLRNCRFTFTTTSERLAQGWTGVMIGEDASQGGRPANSNRILDNVFEKWGIWDPYEHGGPHVGTYAGSRYNVIQGNTFRSASHSNVRLASPYNLVLGNTFNNDQQKNVELGSNAQQAGGAGFNLIEGNDFGQAEWNREEHGGMHVHVYSEHNIIRRNVFHDAAAKSIDFFLDTQTGRNNARFGTAHNHVFHNTFANNSIKHFDRANRQYRVYASVWDLVRWSDQDAPLAGNVFKNNILFANRPVEGGDRQIFMNLHAAWPWAGHVFTGNLIQPADGREDAPIGYVLGVGELTAAANHPKHFFANRAGDPLFRRFEPGEPTDQRDGRYDFRLRKGSPAIDAGVDLARTVAPGTNTRTVAVDDSWYFHDGFGGAIPPDQARIGSHVVTIVTIDRARHVLTVDRPISFAAGAPVNLPFGGGAPDIGAYEVELPGAAGFANL